MNKDSNDNALFITEQCNNHCLMCCQPPKKVDDIKLHYHRNLNIIESAPDDLTEIGITGGEPTMAGEYLFKLIDAVRDKWPNAILHILTNGRSFADESFLDKLLSHTGEKVYMGIPLHSDYGKDHDMIAGAKGSFVETMRGLYNLAERNVEIELRIVLNKLNTMRLPQMAEFIFKNLTFVGWVAFMGMERCGLAIKNHDKIWIEPISYIRPLEKAMLTLSSRGIDSVIYNIPLCLLPKSLHAFAAKSISDWKVRYLSQCDSCDAKESCCGTFSTSSMPYDGISALNEYFSS
ncbi:MAG: His-Xaa-Ser system radical SAM maturase HxsC [Bacteroides heparinolyticus]|nr:His-Xaa-Ser system radical SAM maturase HxsC [Bacteroides heparinolyticus]